MNFRKKVMLVKNDLSKKQIRNHINDIERHFSKNNSSSNSIGKLLNQASQHVPYYNGRTNIELKKFPIVNKQIILNNLNKFISTNFDIDSAHIMETSGSTGEKFKIYQNSGKRDRVIADLDYFYRRGDYEIGLPLLYAGTFPEKKSKINRLITNIKEIDITIINDSIYRNVVDEIKDNKYESMLSYSSFLIGLLEYMISNNVYIDSDNSLKSIFTSASYMPLQYKIALEKHFKVPVYDRYSNQESGVIAQTKGGNTPFYVNTASFYVEILKENSDKPALLGEVGRVVVTDLYNFLMPLIRYDTGDLAVAEKYTDHYGTEIISAVHGRVVNSFKKANDDIITTHALNDFFLLDNYQFSKYQVIVNRNKIEVRLNKSEQGLYNADILVKRFSNFVGEGFDINIIFTTEFEYSKANKFEPLIVVN